jgi:hypothetical protein
MRSAREKSEAVRLWYPVRSALAPGLEWPMVSAKELVMADRRAAACHLPAASLWAAPDRETACLKEAYSELESLLGRPMAEVRAQARRQHPPRQCQHLQCRHLQYRRWKAVPWMRRQAASEMPGLAVEGRRFGTVHLDW